MFTKMSGPDQHFNAFYKDNSILIQFIIVEFVQTNQLIFQIKTLFQNRLNTIHDFNNSYSSLVKIFERLIGGIAQQERHSFSSWKKGNLTKFKEYCYQFSFNSSHADKQHIDLHMAVHQVWLAAINSFEILNSLHINPNRRDADSFLVTLKRSFNSLLNRFNQVIRHIPRVLKDYWSNENVIFCLLRKRVHLVEIYGSDFLTKSFKWPNKAIELMKWMIQRYTERGFESFLPRIQQIIDSTGILNDSC